jgi:succinate dehydrogenase flavin-adding protein (antitoxin of CptAB toxin-antitoxin module)
MHLQQVQVGEFLKPAEVVFLYLNEEMLSIMTSVLDVADQDIMHLSVMQQVIKENDEVDCVLVL